MTTVQATPPVQRGRPSTAERATAYAVAAWSLAFAAVNVVQLTTGELAEGELAGHGTGLVVMAVLVLVLKLVAAGVALAAVRPASGPSWPLATALWGAASLLVLYSLGNIAITAATLSGLVEPSAAWEAAGGVTGRSLTYLVFFLAAAPLFTALALFYQRRLRPPRSALVVGIVGAPLLLGAVLGGAPGLLRALGLFP